MTDERIETGALKIDGDWTGLFVRGDDAFYLRGVLEDVYKTGRAIEAPFINKLIRIITMDVSNSQSNKVQRIKTK